MWVPAAGRHKHCPYGWKIFSLMSILRRNDAKHRQFFVHMCTLSISVNLRINIVILRLLFAEESVSPKRRFFAYYRSE